MSNVKIDYEAVVITDPDEIMHLLDEVVENEQMIRDVVRKHFREDQGLCEAINMMYYEYNVDPVKIVEIVHDEGGYDDDLDLEFVMVVISRATN